MATPPGSGTRNAQLNVNAGSGKQINASQIGGHDNNQYNASFMYFAGNHNTQRSIKEVIRWFSPVDPFVDHIAARQVHQPGTGDWLFQRDEYRVLLDNDRSPLWLNAIPGGGKTVLCSTIIEDLRQRCEEHNGREQHGPDHREHVVAFFYCSFADHEKRSYGFLLRSLVAQLATGDEDATAVLRRAHNLLRWPADYELEDLLRSISTRKRIYIVVDALDEVSEEFEAREKLLSGLKRIISQNSGIQAIMTSRNVNDIRYAMEEVGVTEISLDTRAVDEDIQNYISKQIAGDRRLSELGSGLKEEIQDKIATKSDRMFRWADLQMQKLKRLKVYQRDRILKAIADMPGSLDDMYARMIDDIAMDCRPYALVWLQWLAYAERPMRLDELRETVLIDLEANTVKIDQRGGIEDVLSVLSGLVLELENPRPGVGSKQYAARSVRLAHFSVKEYLESDRIPGEAQIFHLVPSRVQLYLTQRCVLYMLWCQETEGYVCKLYHKLMTEHPLLNYTAHFWHHHARQHHDDDVSFETKLLSSPAHTGKWLKLSDPAPIAEYDHTRGTPSAGFYYAALLGLPRVLEQLHEAEPAVNKSYDMYGRSALGAAAGRGHEECVKMLLKAGAQVNMCCEQHHGALEEAAKSGHITIVDLLLSSGTDVGSPQFFKAIEGASENGRLDVLRRLLGLTQDVEPLNEPDRYTSAVFQAAQCGKSNSVRCLLHEGFITDTDKKSLHKLALQGASLQGNKALVEYLIDHGVNEKARSQNSRALFFAAREGFSDIVRILLSKCVSRRSLKDVGEHTHMSLLKAETEKDPLPGLGPFIWSTHGVLGSALVAASHRGHLEIVEMLLGQGAHEDSSWSDYGSAICAAAKGSHCVIAKHLLEAGADADYGGHRGNPLCEAVRRGCLEMVKLLIDHEADPNLYDSEKSALYLAAKYDHHDIVQYLHDNGAMLRVRDANNSREISGLLRARRRDVNDAVDLLIKLAVLPKPQQGPRVAVNDDDDSVDSEEDSSDEDVIERKAFLAMSESEQEKYMDSFWATMGEAIHQPRVGVTINKAPGRSNATQTES